MPIGPEDNAVNFTPTNIGTGIRNIDTYVIEYEDPDNPNNYLFAKTQSEGSTNFGPFRTDNATFPLEVGTTLTAFVASNASLVRVRITSGPCSGTTEAGPILGFA